MIMSAGALKERVKKLESLDQHLTFRIARLAKLLEIDGSLRIGDSGVNLTGYRIMLVISTFERISVSDLSKVMLIDRAQISRAAADLIDRGILAAFSDPNSKRKKLLGLTDQGQALFTALKKRFDERQDGLETLLTQTELDNLWRSIDKFSERLEGLH